MAKYEYKTLSGIDEKIAHIIAKLGLKATYSVKQAIDGQQNFYILQTHFKDTKVMFKARIADHRVLRQWGKNFRNERRFLRALSKENPKPLITEHIPLYIKSQLNGPEWLMCQFIDKNPIGSSNISYDKPTKSEILKIIDLLLVIQNFPIEEFLSQHHWSKNVPRMDFDHYHHFFTKIIQQARKNIIPILDENLLNQANDILLKNKKILNNNCNLLSHGDFHPANIIVNHHAIALDWEELHIDNASFDVVDLWFRMADHQVMRRFLLTEFAKVTKQKAVFQDLFRLNLLVRLPEEIGKIWSIRANQADLTINEQRKAQKILKLCYSNYMSALNNDKLDQYE